MNLCAKYLLEAEVVEWMGRYCSMGQLENLAECAGGLTFDFLFRDREGGDAGEWTGTIPTTRMAGHEHR